MNLGGFMDDVLGLDPGGSTTTSTANPPGYLQPYLNQYLQQLQNTYNNSRDNMGYYGGDTVANLTDQQRNALNQMYSFNNNFNGLDPSSGNFYRQVLNGSNLNNPTTGGLNNIANSRNPFSGLATRQSTANPFTNGETNYFRNLMNRGTLQNNGLYNQLRRESNGAYLNHNPYIDSTFRNASNGAMNDVMSRFAGSGRFGSGSMAGAMGTALGQVTDQVYGQNYENERNRQQNAQNLMLGMQQNDLNARMGAGSNLSQIDSTRAGIQQGWANLGAGLHNSDMSNRLNALNGLSNNWQFNRNLQNNAAGNLSNLGALNFGLNNQAFQNMLNSGSFLQNQNQRNLDDQFARWQYGQQRPWDLLNNYGSLLGVTGGLNTNQTQNNTQNNSGSQNLGNLLLGGSALNSLTGGGLATLLGTGGGSLVAGGLGMLTGAI